MHYPKWLKPLCVLLAIAWLAWLLAGPRPESRPMTQISAVARIAPSSNSPYLGSSSCAAARCHGGTYEPNKPAWTSAYTVWRAEDKHASAYADLLSPRGQQIAERYFESASVRAQDDDRCVVCHRTPKVPDAISLAEGVGCESCHGPAEAWRSEHYTAKWKESRTAPGFRDLRKLDERAKSCVPCHVGAPNQEVNHDLIASGHPPLRFELGAYHEQLPKHWDFSAEKAADSQFEARLWLTGQIESSRAALELAGRRRIWPELAEYDCESCHHSLGEGQPGSAGKPLWGTWYFSPRLTEIITAGDSRSQPDLTDLRASMDRFAPADDVRRTPQSILAAWPHSSAQASWPELISLLSQPVTAAADETWSAAAQRWLALAALAPQAHEELLRTQRMKLAEPARFKRRRVRRRTFWLPG